ncbi:MAG TPA: nucleotide exchange factor GrpE [Bryobacteraceae bacterium]
MSTEEFNIPHNIGMTEEPSEQPGETPELPAGDPTAELQAELAALTEERDKLLNEKQEFYDRLLRAQAEFDNARRRAERERSEFVQYAGTEMVREILPIVDDFERALQSGTALADGPAKNYIKGMELIYQRLVDRLTKLGLEPIDTKGQLFDPNLHQAVERAETNDVPDQTILSEFQRGYTLKGRLLRPSMVKVAVHP